MATVYAVQLHLLGLGCSRRIQSFSKHSFRKVSGTRSGPIQLSNQSLKLLFPFPKPPQRAVPVPTAVGFKSEGSIGKNEARETQENNRQDQDKAMQREVAQTPANDHARYATEHRGL